MMQAPLYVVLGILLLTQFPAFAETAADVDWVPREQLDAATRADLPWFCQGTYIEPPPADNLASGETRATADTTSHVIGDYTLLTGKVEIEQGYLRIQSPSVRLDEQTDIARLEGPLLLRDQGLTVVGASGTSNLFEGTGVIDSGTFLLHQSRFRGKANQIERLASTDVLLTAGEFTRCEPDSNAWAIRGQRILLKPAEGYGTARDVTIRVKDVPVVWVPYLKFPLNDERQSGFLMPGAGYDGTGGTDISVPYYFNIAPALDATYEPRSIWKRGLVHDGQVRFLAGASSNEVNLGFIANDKIWDNRNLIDATSQGTNTGSVTIPPFERQNRWYTNLRHEGNWSRAWQTSGSYNAVSDIDYLREIGGDIGSSAVEQFTGAIDQSLGSNVSAVLDRRAEITHRAGNWHSSLLLQGFQNIDPLAQEQYEVLPRVRTRYRDKIAFVDLSTELEYTVFDKDTSGITGPLAIVGERTVLDTEVSMRKSTRWGFLAPALGITHRAYTLDDTPAGYRTDPSVTTPRFSLDGGLFFDRFFSFSGRSYQQTLEPRLFYLYVEDDYQDDLPQFDSGLLTPGFSQLFRTNRFTGRDRLGDANQLSIGLTSKLLANRTGAQLVEASIGQIYYFEDRSVLFRAQSGDDPTRGQSPLFTRLRLNLSDSMSVSGSYEWEPDVNRSNRGTFSLKYAKDDRRLLNLSYIYNSPEVQATGPFVNEEESDASIIWPIPLVSDRLSGIGRWRYSWDRNQTVDAFWGVEYNDCCLKMRLVVRRYLQQARNVTVLEDDPGNPGGFVPVNRIITPSDSAIFFEFQLKGISTLGRRLDMLLEQSIPGYSQREKRLGN
ncbi:MAG: LPS-assembly protein LptD [Pseudomonadota bacterium]